MGLGCQPAIHRGSKKKRIQVWCGSLQILPVTHLKVALISTTETASKDENH